MLTDMRGRRMSPVNSADYDRAHDTLVSAFQEDPVYRWLYPDETQFAEHVPELIAAYDRLASLAGSIWQLDDFAAVALWLPPGTVVNPERVGQVLVGTVDEDQHAELFSALEQMEARKPNYLHWHLAMLGVRAGDQNRGLGGELLADCLELIDAAGMPAFLEARNPRTVPFFERHGFVETARTTSPTGPPLISMLREAR
jgi:ribosomal protein S18 acetylase RimI-like enzyme